jgi:hypothetical protein
MVQYDSANALPQTFLNEYSEVNVAPATINDTREIAAVERANEEAEKSGE